MARRAEAGVRLMAWGSTVPAAVDALVALLRTASGLEGVKVFDGPGVTGSSQTEAVMVGVGANEDPTAVDGRQDREGLSTARDREQYEIRCALAVVNGSGDISAARRRAYELLGVVGGVLASDQRLGGAVLNAQLGSAAFTQDQTEQGAEAVISFTVDVDAFTHV
jgi:hypothetical protein